MKNKIFQSQQFIHVIRHCAMIKLCNPASGPIRMYVHLRGQYDVVSSTEPWDSPAPLCLDPSRDWARSSDPPRHPCRPVERSPQGHPSLFDALPSPWRCFSPVPMLHSDPKHGLRQMRNWREFRLGKQLQSTYVPSLSVCVMLTLSVKG